MTTFRCYTRRDYLYQLAALADAWTAERTYDLPFLLRYYAL